MLDWERAKQMKKLLVSSPRSSFLTLMYIISPVCDACDIFIDRKCKNTASALHRIPNSTAAFKCHSSELAFTAIGGVNQQNYCQQKLWRREIHFILFLSHFLRLKRSQCGVTLRFFTCKGSNYQLWDGFGWFSEEEAGLECLSDTLSIAAVV